MEFGKTYLDSEGWTGLTIGNMPLVISVPHGGYIDLEEVEDRSCNNAITVTDKHTKELALEIALAMSKFHGSKPYLVICNLVRKDIDQNRDLKDAVCGNELMEKPWHVFHDFIDTALAMATKQFGGCIYIDLHGHGHAIQRLEIGYLLKEKDLKNLRDTATLPVVKSKSSLANYFKQNPGTGIELFTGPNSFGTMMANEGYPSVPSQQDPFPAEGDKYFNGGYNSKRYTGEKYPNVFGWQIESNYKGVRDPAGRPAFAIAFCKVITNYIKTQTAFKWPVISK